jgi:hypothetical protein
MRVGSNFEQIDYTKHTCSLIILAFVSLIPYSLQFQTVAFPVFSLTNPIQHKYVRK